MEKLIGLKEFRENVDAVIKKVNHGQSFIILKKSKPIFKVSKIVPAIDLSSEDDWETIADFTEGGKKTGVEAGKLIKLMQNGLGAKTIAKHNKKRS
jgi:hypothetical protein